ncbi:hypothetical protein QFZ77_004793 [Paenibacillus sp. V4I3]|uniref:phospholipase D-like domain-containing protein n=1 Tax=Paenibacillus sp. V4I3 TaxID=3042305 RepID=UPI002789E70C|nr:phospholipase D-like domain-containing protein [Paenibacillus sp. V4I3]MDQ0876134.1 hypothetical protein [Paenibacillus sp. V4I3]
MSVEVFFTRPGSNSETLERIKLDVKYAKKRLFISQYFLTEAEINGLVESCNVNKRIILNDDGYKFHHDPTVVILGSKYFQSYMHHKFLIIDDILWTGTLNLSENASRSNWENMMRIRDESIIESFASEFKKMFILGKALAKSAINPKTCRCGEEYTDPFQHYNISFEKEIYAHKVETPNSKFPYFYINDEEKHISSVSCKIKGYIPPILYCEGCGKRVDKEKELSCTYNRVPCDFESRDFLKEDDNILETHFPEFSSLYKRFCHSCMFDYFDNEGMLDSFFVHKYFEEITISQSSDYIGRWTRFSAVTITSSITFPGDFIFNITSGSNSIGVYVNLKSGLEYTNFNEKFKPGSVVNLKAIPYVYEKKSGDKVPQLQLIWPCDIEFA